MYLTIFFICSLINVMLSTVKSILTVKSTKLVATIINAVSYSFYTIIVKQMVGLSFEMTVIITFVSNMIGVYSSMWILERFKKDRLWKISITTEDTTITDKLEKYNIAYKMSDVVYKGKTYFSIDVFSETQKDSQIIKNILSAYDVKYNVTEINQNL